MEKLYHGGSSPACFPSLPESLIAKPKKPADPKTGGISGW
jgi:hypothetical protein